MSSIQAFFSSWILLRRLGGGRLVGEVVSGTLYPLFHSASLREAVKTFPGKPYLHPAKAFRLWGRGHG